MSDDSLLANIMDVVFVLNEITIHTKDTWPKLFGFKQIPDICLKFHTANLVIRNPTFYRKEIFQILQ